ncbi:YjcZ family sporulation protein [Peribacillus sp. TH14]|uniref:YjcZ family sporulation protein n=1 Tax=Peribacillus sp. TH14 TaxID=2798481 RepID=UPI0019118A0C|nr:YjcZ family sporulation protein [Peribacillus sp. TH14]MBK5501648.1 YjcZ family sporulation protein [Peribacillus sp. TH14]
MNRGGGFAFIIVLFILLIILELALLVDAAAITDMEPVVKNSMKKIEVGQRLRLLSSKSVTARFHLYRKLIPSRF